MAPVALGAADTRTCAVSLVVIEETGPRARTRTAYSPGASGAGVVSVTRKVRAPMGTVAWPVASVAGAVPLPLVNITSTSAPDFQSSLAPSSPTIHTAAAPSAFQ